MGRTSQGITRGQLVLGLAVFAGLAWLTEKYVVEPRVKGGLTAATRDANEAAAVLTVGEIGLAELQFHLAYPEAGFACSLGALGGPVGQLRAQSAHTLPPDAAMGHRNGYLFAIGDCSKMMADGKGMITGYKITAVPESPGQTGRRSFCADESRAITVDTSGGTNCTEALH